MNSTFKKISMIGLGYIGLPTATLFASKQCYVLGIDVMPSVVDTINEGKIHIVEPELDILVQKAVSEGYLKAALTPEPADVFLIAVPTPFKDDYKPDLIYIEAAATSIAPVLAKGNLVILESTSPVGTTEQLEQWLATARPDLSFPSQAGDNADIQIAYCPERVLPGKVVQELVDNDRIIGGLSNKATELATELYKIFVKGSCIPTNARTAEMCKLTENSFRDVNIAFANELSMICDELDINVWELIALANRHPRVNILQPGAGVGGHCIAVDPWFIVDKTPNKARLIRTAREVNDIKPEWVLDKVKAAIFDEIKNSNRSISDIKVACLGLAFKPDIDDLRESPAVAIVQKITQLGCHVLTVEPNIDVLPEKLAQVMLKPLDDVIASADVICVLVKHREFIDAILEIKEKKSVIDAVGLLA